ncbi:nitrite reductase small subunit NirD [Shewanella pneumatophori]|uniref:Nitrite reductase small subunit NirD n=1 Tax=Shewanella pneumatophori TaxID=314092 RepID=A0A9X2CBR0_9GAMM|nr:nitrite reductase small subunit NirD [Shewanella pneumatophori]MCL1137028.1 nitrite reductase small subunit NirD [Shewanella pneumatophori]
MSWVTLCEEAALPSNRGVAAWALGKAIALFNMGDKGIFALDNIDPATGVSVLSRGLICELGNQMYVSSPIHKQHYDLQTGQCLESATLKVNCYEVKKLQGKILAKVTSVPTHIEQQSSQSEEE